LLNAFHFSGSLLFRALTKVNRGTTKLLHAGLHFFVILGSSVALAAAIEMHLKDNPQNHFFSLHSWLGLAAFTILYLQVRHEHGNRTYTDLSPYKQLLEIFLE